MRLNNNLSESWLWFACVTNAFWCMKYMLNKFMCIDEWIKVKRTSKKNIHFLYKIDLFEKKSHKHTKHSNTRSICYFSCPIELLSVTVFSSGLMMSGCFPLLFCKCWINRCLLVHYANEIIKARHRITSPSNSVIVAAHKTMFS